MIGSPKLFPERKRIKLLLVEDDMADIQLMREALKDAGEWCDLTVATTGAQALDMLFRRGKYKSLEPPDLVLLDIQLPILSGHEVLNAIKCYSPLNLLPVIILSTSQSRCEWVRVKSRMLVSASRENASVNSVEFKTQKEVVFIQGYSL
jgi:chemotaxis family two-component system response regulator Rcp1